ncbi:MAG: hypothetical protein HY088_01450 [Ignavibacteriales bacterium]|nr:hypothetical protein [Ignavibacteriales bacterium]
MINLPEILKGLAESRPIFHSEADFQFSFAWYIQQQNPNCSIRLEYKPESQKREYVDIMIRYDESVYFIETKYKTKELQIEAQREAFALANQGAGDQGGYDFLRDIERLERWVKEDKCSKAAAIFLTNDYTCWKSRENDNTIGAQFRIWQGKRIHGNLNWTGGADGSKRGREGSINIQGSYTLDWKKYSSQAHTKNGLFKYLIINVGNI